jgi:hypothetical protein
MMPTGAGAVEATKAVNCVGFPPTPGLQGRTSNSVPDLARCPEIGIDAE